MLAVGVESFLIEYKVQYVFNLSSNLVNIVDFIILLAVMLNRVDHKLVTW